MGAILGENAFPPIYFVLPESIVGSDRVGLRGAELVRRDDDGRNSTVCLLVALGDLREMAGVEDVLGRAGLPAERDKKRESGRSGCEGCRGEVDDSGPSLKTGDLRRNVNLDKLAPGRCSRRRCLVWGQRDSVGGVQLRNRWKIGCREHRENLVGGNEIPHFSIDSEASGGSRDDNENRGGQYVPPAAFLSWNGDCADGEAHECNSDSHPHDDPEGENEISKDLEDVPNEPRCYSEERSSCGCSHE